MNIPASIFVLRADLYLDREGRRVPEGLPPSFRAEAEKLTAGAPVWVRPGAGTLAVKRARNSEGVHEVSASDVAEVEGAVLAFLPAADSDNYATAIFAYRATGAVVEVPLGRLRLQNP